MGTSHARHFHDHFQGASTFLGAPPALQHCPNCSSQTDKPPVLAFRSEGEERKPLLNGPKDSQANDPGVPLPTSLVPPQVPLVSSSSMVVLVLSDDS